jgi:ABC-2 type transport system ATP-binding protein
VIEVQSLTKRFGATTAVDRLSFIVRPGKVTGFLGPNGAGKTTTMRMILGLDRPTSGRATINGKPYHALRDPLFEVGAVLDARAVHGGRRAFDHLLCLAQSNGIGRRRVREVIEIVGLSAVSHRRIGGYSLGMSQRLGLAAALLGDPAVVMLDEPVNGLDPEGIHWIRTFLRGLAAEGRTVFVSSHLMSEMALTADHLVVIGRGRLLADASMSEVLRDAPQAITLVRSPHARELANVLASSGATTRAADSGGLEVAGLSSDEIGELAFRHGFALHELTPQQPSLEEAFLELTTADVEYRAGGAA